MGSDLGHRPGLDGMRGVAIALVLGAHFGIGPMLTGGGGVTLFFVLSGYLITRLLLEERDRAGTVHLPAFYVRRARRLVPVLLAVVPVYLLVAMSLGADWRRGLIASVTYTTNYLGPGHDLTPFDATWSLAIEEHFYLVWPVVLMLAGRHLVPVAVVGALSAAVVRTILVLDGTPYEQVYQWTHTRADGLLAGCALGALAHQGRRWLPPGPAVGLAVGVLVVYSTALPDHDDIALWGITASVGAGAVLIAWGAESANAALCSAPLRHLGRISYSLYLWHFAVWRTLGRGWVPLLLSIGLAEASYRVIERGARGRRGPDNEPASARRAVIPSTPPAVT